MESEPSKASPFLKNLTPKKLVSWVGLWALVMLVCLALANMAVSTPAWAVSADELLDIMVDEGAITPEKAQKIKEKARKLDKAKQAQEDAKRAQELQQIKQEAKSEAKAEAKAEAAKEAKATVEKTVADQGLEGISKALKGLNVGVLAYIDYSMGDRPTFKGPRTFATRGVSSGNAGRDIDGHVGLNQWTLQRGYLNVTKEITPWLYARYTPDLYQDANGNWNLRQKYLYAELRPPDLGHILTQNKAEIGLDHTPWHDFEEHIWPYRCQGTIPIERAGVFNSADIGVNIRGNFGGKLANAKEKVGSDHYDGRYGSYQVGVYNGCGYNLPENNYKNKVPEYRVTIRPLPDHLPGLQATYFGLFGQGNNSTTANFTGTPNLGPPPVPAGFYKSFFPDWIVNMGYVSYQHPWFLLAGQIFATKGNQTGNWTTQPTGPGVIPNPVGQRANALWTRGYALYGDAMVPWALSIPWWKGDQKYPLHVYARFDWFDADVDHVIAENATYRKLITGLAYHLYKDNLILMGYERTWYGSDFGASFTRPGSVGGTGPNGTGNRVAALASDNGNLGTDQRFQVVFQISY